MKAYIFALCALASFAFASPLRVIRLEDLPTSSNDLVGNFWLWESTHCEPYIFIFARGSTEPGNMGDKMGPLMCKSLKSKLGSDNVACQGVGGPYTADLPSNTLPGGTSEGAWKEAIRLFQKASTCRNSKIIAGGYSQGTAVMMNAISKASPELRSRIKGTVLFGYTQNSQQNGEIPNYDKQRLKVFCSWFDGVCTGVLVVTPGHYAYSGDSTIADATQFLIGASKT